MKLYGRVNGVETEIAGGGGGSSGSPVETVLYNNMNLTVEPAVNVQCNLSQPYTNFDEIKIEYAYFYIGSVGDGKIFPAEYRYSVADLEAMRTSSYNERKGYLLLNLYLSFVNMYVSLDITSTSILTINDVQKSNNQYKQYITKITGIKY